jgi:hypothetical protein
VRALGRTLAIVALAAVAALTPAAAQAKPRPQQKPQAQPLVDIAPFRAYFKDRVLRKPAKPHAHRAATGAFAAYPTKEGTSVNVAISDAYNGQVTSAVAQSYVDFLDSLDHGPELAMLRVVIAPSSEVVSTCGGQDGTLACYDSSNSTMYVPGEPTTTADGVTTSYVVAHEYGHHIAANRSNPPFGAFGWGPKYWASYQHVCDRATRGLLSPGDEGANYSANPGEGWAETYAQLKYPDVAWQFTPLLKPDAGAFAAARQDVLTPWAHPVTKIFTGTFRRSGSNTRRFAFPLNLDGSMSVRLYGPHNTNYNLAIASNGADQGHTSTAGSRDRLSFKAACRKQTSEQVVVAVKRVTGSGPFTMRVSYAG